MESIKGVVRPLHVGTEAGRVKQRTTSPERRSTETAASSQPAVVEFKAKGPRNSESSEKPSPVRSFAAASKLAESIAESITGDEHGSELTSGRVLAAFDSD